jgi:hypothetical protein
MPAALSAAALVILAAACGSSASSGSATAAAKALAGVAQPRVMLVSPASAGPVSIGPGPAGSAKLTGAAAAALVARAVANTQAASSVRVTGQAVAAGTGGKGPASQTVSFDMALVKNVGCEGTMAVSKAPAVKVVQAAGYTWMLPSRSSYTDLRLSKPALALIANKYIRVKSTASQAGDLPAACTFTGLLGGLPRSADAAVPVTYNGTPAYEVSESGKQGTAFVSNAAQPLLLRLANSPGNGGTITFTRYNATAVIAVPTAAESVDGSKLGV